MLCSCSTLCLYTFSGVRSSPVVIREVHVQQQVPPPQHHTKTKPVTVIGINSDSNSNNNCNIHNSWDRQSRTRTTELIDEQDTTSIQSTSRDTQSQHQKSQHQQSLIQRPSSCPIHLTQQPSVVVATEGQTQTQPQTQPQLSSQQQQQQQRVTTRSHDYIYDPRIGMGFHPNIGKFI